MKNVLIGWMSLMASIVFGQGLNGELGFNDDYSQNARAVVAFEDGSIFVKEQTLSASFFTRSSIIKVDTLGNEIWDIPIFPQSAEVVTITEMIPSETNGLYVLGYGRPTCDVAGGCFWFLQKIDLNGILEWEKTWNDPVCFGTTVSGLRQSQTNRILVHLNDPFLSAIYTFDTNGNDISSIETTNNGFQGIDQLSGYHSIAYKQFSVFGFDGAGNTTATRTFSTFISDMQVWNDSLFLITQDSAFLLDNNFQTLAANNINGFDHFSNLKVRNADVRWTSTSPGGITLFQLNRSFQIENSQTIPVDLNMDYVTDYHDDHLTLALDFPLSEHFTIRHLDYSLNDSQNETVNRTDIGIVDIQITQAVATPDPNFDAVFQVEIGADVLVKNFGNNTLENCRMNHYISPALACGQIYYGASFFNLNLAPGDSAWVPLGTIHTNQRTFLNDSLNQEICIYTSFPNTVTDLMVSNDRLCTTVTLGTAHLNELSQANKKVVKMVDLLGRTVKNTEAQVVVYIYNDGTTEKVFITP